MNIHSSRFGTIECEESETIEFASGLIGFPREQSFILIRHGSSQAIAWLQSAITPELAFPVVSAHGLLPEYPDVPVVGAAEAAGMELSAEDEYAVMVVLSAPPGQPATVNLLAPIVVDVARRRGAQVFLDGSRFTTRELFVLPSLASSAREADDSIDDERDERDEPGMRPALAEAASP